MKKATTKKIAPLFDTSFLDTTTRPQDDFFHFGCGGWLKKNPIPSSQSSWGSFYKLRDDVLKQNKEILEEIVASKKLNDEQQLLKVLYSSGMDMAKRNKEGVQPLQKELARIESIQTVDDLISFFTYAEKNGSGILWHTFVAEDEKDSSRYISYLAQGGLTLPDRDFYLKGDVKSKQIRSAYLEYIEALLRTLGKEKKEAAKSATEILLLETQLAHISMDRTSARQVEKIYNKVSVAKLQKLAPIVAWEKHFTAIGLRDASECVVMQPEFMRGLLPLIQKTPLSVWKAYLSFSLIDDAAPYLSQKLISTRFRFYGKVIQGQETQTPLWKRTVGVVNSALGFALGKEYVARYFPEDAKKKIHTLVDYIFAAYEARIKKLEWMSPTTKKKALLKLASMERKLGFPDRWQSYRGLKLSPENSYYENILTSTRFEQRRNFKRLGKKVDRKEWFTTPQTVNAFYNPNQNEIAFPAAILQPPFFSPDIDDAVNFGAMGSVIGHELTHGFDDEGSKFDERGNYKNWWTKEDRARFDAETKKLVRQFNQYKVDDLSVNGAFTLGENIADLGGIVIAYDAYQKYLEENGRGDIKGYTPEQRFFIGLVMFECAATRKEWARTLVMIDPHSPSMYRVNGPLSNIDAFYEAFEVKPGDALYRSPKSRIKIW